MDIEQEKKVHSDIEAMAETYRKIGFEINPDGIYRPFEAVRGSLHMIQESIPLREFLSKNGLLTPERSYQIEKSIVGSMGTIENILANLGPLLGINSPVVREFDGGELKIRLD